VTASSRLAALDLLKAVEVSVKADHGGDPGPLQPTDDQGVNKVHVA
jgi:hypothetical protein